MVSNFLFTKGAFEAYDLVKVLIHILVKSPSALSLQSVLGRRLEIWVKRGF